MLKMLINGLNYSLFRSILEIVSFIITGKQLLNYFKSVILGT